MNGRRGPVKSSPGLKKFSISDRSILERRIKTNPRYNGVQPKTNTGFNTYRKKELEKEIRKYYKVKNDEVFRRISLADLLQLMTAHAEDVQDEAAELEEAVGSSTPLKYRDEVDECVHKMDQIQVGGLTAEYECPYLLLDIRPGTDFAKDHLAGAVCQPNARLSRAVGWECKEMLAYKNHPEYIIVVCDEGEDMAGEITATLCHRGYDNVFMLSGGLRLARDKFGFPLVTNDPSPRLREEAAAAIMVQLNEILLPPLTMAQSEEWWASASGQHNSGTPSDFGYPESSTPLSGRSALKPIRPWK